jgi:hypothetical protein
LLLLLVLFVAAVSIIAVVLKHNLINLAFLVPHDAEATQVIILLLMLLFLLLF